VSMLVVGRGGRVVVVLPLLLVRAHLARFPPPPLALLPTRRVPCRRSAARAGAPVSLDACWSRLVAPETLDQANTWFCPSCRDHVQARKTLEVWSLPRILVLHLKRFE
jgi:hypothetical protein